MKHIHSAQGIRYIPKTYLIETGAISAFHEAIIFDEYTHTGKDDFAMTEISKLATPATFSRYLKPGIFETEIDNPYTDRLDGSSEWYYFTEIKRRGRPTVRGVGGVAPLYGMLAWIDLSAGTHE